MAQVDMAEVAKNSQGRVQAAVPRPDPVLGVLLRGDKPHQFLTLDALRGVAALAVIVFHGWPLFLPIRFASGYLAVDFFFLLSGFVLSHAYGQKLDRGWSTANYLKTRIVRLYPLYLLGLVLGIVLHLGIGVLRHEPLADAEFWASILLGLLLLPKMPARMSGSVTAFPLNYPSWSIFFELIVNLLQAALLRRRSTRALVAITAGSLACVVAYAWVRGSLNVGVNSPDNLLCVVRVLFFYCLGTLLYRLWRQGRIRMRVSPLIPALVLLGALAMPIPTSRWLVAQEMLITVGVFPPLLLLAATAEPSPALRPLFRLLGQLSYPVYILHGPLLSLAEQLRQRVGSASRIAASPWAGLLFLILLGAASLFADRVYDLPVRKALRRRWLPSREATA